MADNVIEVQVKVVDQASEPLEKVNNATQKTDNSLTNLQKKNDKSFFDKLGDACFKLNNIFESVQNVYQKTIGRVWDAGVSSEQTNVAFEVLMGDAQKAKDFLQDINSYGNATPYDNAALQQNAKTMLSFGISANDTSKYLKQIGDIAMGDKAKMDSLSLAFAQSMSAGKLSGGDLLQMINAGFNPLEELTRITGKSMDQLKNDMSKGLITTDLLQQAFKAATSEGGKFYGMSEKMSQTIGGKMSTVQGKIQDLAAKIFDYLSPVITAVVDQFMPALELASEAIDNIASFVKEWGVELGILVGVIGIAYVAINAVSWATKIWQGVQWLLNAALTANPIGIVVVAVGALIVAIVAVCRRIEGWSTLWEAFGNFFTGTWEVCKNSFMLGIEAIEKKWYQFKSLFGIGDESENQAMIKQLDDSVESRMKAISEGSKKVATAWDNVDLKWKQKEVTNEELDKLKFSTTIDNGNKKDTSLAASVNNMMGGDGTSGNSAIQQATNGVATGGTKNTSITINLDKFFENIVYEQGGVEDNAQDTLSKFQEMLYRTLYMAQSAV